MNWILETIKLQTEYYTQINKSHEFVFVKNTYLIKRSYKGRVYKCKHCGSIVYCYFKLKNGKYSTENSAIINYNGYKNCKQIIMENACS